MRASAARTCFARPGSTDAFAISGGAVRTSQSWSVGLEWSDVLRRGNALGMAVGQPIFATDLERDATPAGSRFDQLGGLVKTTFRY